jgi:hypothetical protein
LSLKNTIKLKWEPHENWIVEAATASRATKDISDIFAMKFH